MDDFKDSFSTKEETNTFTDLSKNDSPLLDMDSFETLESQINAASGFGADTENSIGKNLIDDPFGISPSGLISTTRPLVTSNDDDDEKSESPKGISPSSPGSNLLDYVNIAQDPSLIDIGADTRVEDTHRDPVPEPRQQRSSDVGDQLLIGSETGGSVQRSLESERLLSALESDDFSTLSFNKAYESAEIKETLPKIKDPKIVAADNYKPVETRAYEPAAQSVKKVAMEAEKNSTDNSNDCDCAFAPGAWFNPEKLHPVVAKYVYWKDPKRSGIALGTSLVLLFSFKFFSVISVVAYLTLALLLITISFRIYKNILQAVQKSNEGHPFKEYLDMDITLSQDKVGETVEVMIQHLNCVSGKLRSLVLVEDLVDTIKLGIFAWCLTYVGAWFNGLTLVILAVISAFTLPKVYETNKSQIDAYAELVRTKGKEVIEMVNAKMPLGKKKKDQ